MTAPQLAKVWWSASELAELALPGLPSTKRKLNEYAAKRRWALEVNAAGAPLARARAGRGGGTEYHRSLLPPAASIALVERGLMTAEEPGPAPAPDGVWSWYDKQSDAVKAEAARRLAVLDALDGLVTSGLTRSAAAASAARKAGVSPATIWNWAALVAGCERADRLPRLAPRRQGGGKERPVHPAAWRFYCSDYLRLERPTHAACYERTKAAAVEHGWGELPHAKTLVRRFEREVPAAAVARQRSGAEAVRRMLPPQQRTVADLHAMQLVNIDGHRWDVFVRWPDGRIARPMMVAIQDVYSRKMLAWRIGDQESAVQTRLCFADLFRDWGIPQGCVFDNGRAFASKWITGGAETRFRFRIKPDDPLGLLPALGIATHWATPYRGQSKPIERGFRDLCDAVAKHPAFAGAWTGNNPLAKPENYGSTAIPLATFVAVASAGIAAHNARLGRRTEAARGRSFNHAFAESYARSPIGRATPEQLRMALLTAEQLRADSRTGAVSLYGNRYWSAELAELAGERVVVRFDPDALQTEVHVYRADGSYVASAPVVAAVGFLDVQAARARAKLEADHRKAARAASDALQLLSAAELAAMLPEAPFDEDAAPEPKVLRPVRVQRTAAAVAAAPHDPNRFLDTFTAGVSRLRLVE